MKKTSALFLFIVIMLMGNFAAFSQGPPMWAINGNNIVSGSSSFIGTTNASDLILKTNGQERLIIKGTTGGFRIQSLTGIGTALVLTDQNGEVFRRDLPNNSIYVLNGNGTFVPITTLVPATPASGWSTTAGLILADAGKNVGIGVSNPMDKLSVLGNVNIDGRLKVDSIQVGDSSLHIVSQTSTIFDLGSGTVVNGLINEIYSDPTSSPPSGALFINCRNPIPSSPNTFINALSGKVGIGTLSPSHKLTIVGTQRVATGGGSTIAFVDLLPLTGVNNTSIEIGSFTNAGQIDFKGTGNHALDFKGRISYTDGTGFDFFTAGGSIAQMRIQDNGKISFNDGVNNNLVIQKNTSGFPTGGMMIQSQNDLGIRSGEVIFDADQYKFLNGPVKIGNDIAATNHWSPTCVSNCNYSLYVQHGILTERVKVAVYTSSDWSDYVFADDYQLLSLDSVELFIDKNKHLPGVPSSVEMVNNGNDLQTTDKILLEKIENLYLYIIQLNKDIELLKEQNKFLIQQQDEKN